MQALEIVPGKFLEGLESGAALVLEKPVVPDGFAAVFAALEALAGTGK